MEIGPVDSTDSVAVSAEEGLPAGKRDAEGDRRILENLQRIGDQTVTYSYDFRPWSIRVVRAPSGESVELEGVPSGFSYALVFKEMLPGLLQAHLEGLARQVMGESKGFIGVVEEKPVPVLPPVRESVAQPLTVSTDDLIAECFESSEFVNKVFSYVHESKAWDVRIIHNPDLLPLWAEGASEVVRFPYAIIIAGAPSAELVSHLKGLAAARWKRQAGYVSLAGLFQDSFHRSAGLGPILLNRDGNLNTTFDPLIQDCFASKQFINRVFHYQIGDEYFHVRIINNPDKSNIRLVKWFADPYKPQSYTMDWSYRFGIMVDEKAPLELIKHFQDLAKPASSWWDWYRGFYISNGVREIVLKGGVKGTVGDRALFEYARP